MGNWIRLQAKDGHQFDAYRADPAGNSVGGVVIVQEIFGVTAHIRQVADGYAARGYVAIAPALFDRARPGTELAYADVAAGKEAQTKVTPQMALADIAAAIEALRTAGKVAVIGYCWGGTLAYFAACKLDIACAVSYYGGMIAKLGTEKPAHPVQYHVGDRDMHISRDDVAAIRALDPDGVVHVYEGAGHGFNCNERADYHPENARLAEGRSIEFLRTHLA